MPCAAEIEVSLIRIKGYRQLDMSDRIQDKSAVAAGGLPASHADARGRALARSDGLRRWQGQMLDTIGLAPVETPSRLVAAFHGADLIAFEPADAASAAADGPALLIVPAPIKRHYIWDLAPDASA